MIRMNDGHITGMLGGLLGYANCTVALLAYKAWRATTTADTFGLYKDFLYMVTIVITFIGGVFFIGFAVHAFMLPWIHGKNNQDDHTS